MGQKLYYDLRSEHSFHAEMNKLIRELVSCSGGSVQASRELETSVDPSSYGVSNVSTSSSDPSLEEKVAILETKLLGMDSKLLGMDAKLDRLVIAEKN